jgi:hypothetical protein
MHWARGKSTDHANKIVRHLIDAGKRDGQGVRHSARVAWRALAMLQEEIERDEGVPMPRNARLAVPVQAAHVDATADPVFLAYAAPNTPATAQAGD